MPSPVIGTAFAIGLLCLVAAGLWLAWRRPFVALGVLVAGMAFHNFVLMVLLVLRTPPQLIRTVQSWKELVIGVLALLAASQLLRARREWRMNRLIPMDWIAVAFTALLIVYLLLPSSLLPGSANVVQRLLAFRTALLIPLIYFLGRIFSRPSQRDLRDASWIVVAAGAAVGAFGLYELWFVPTTRWLDWGVNLYSNWLGFAYKGPAGLPENFFQSLPDGLLLRRMVSTYISPLGIAYTGLICWPIAVVLLDRPHLSRRAATATGLATALLLLGILFSVTRLALVMLAGEAVILGLLLRTRVALSVAPVVVGCVLAILFVYPHVGPVVNPALLPGASHQQTIIYIGDPSLAEHLRALGGDMRFVIQHPFGNGLGGSVHRFVDTNLSTTGTGESALLGMFGDLGLVGGALYVAMYVFGLYYGLRALSSTPGRSLADFLPLVACVGGLALAPITLTSDVWSDFSVTFLYWWAAGYSASVAARRLAAMQQNGVGQGDPVKSEMALD
ncbi:MAG: hypothetical protein ACYDA0_14400 [Candidatus Dormibacteraceae bacterium]